MTGALDSTLKIESLLLESASMQDIAAYIDAVADEIIARCQANAQIISMCEALIAVAATLDNTFS
jgi:hypothetical protein